MKLHVLSDLHLEHAGMAPVKVCGDALVLAGDIAPAKHLSTIAPVIEPYVREGKPVLYVAGNHEYYGRRMPEALLQMHRDCRKLGVEFLHNRLVTIGDVRFYGATGWTDYELTKGEIPLEQQMAIARMYLNDHSVIFVPKDQRGQLEKTYRTFDPKDARKAHDKAMRLLRARLSEPFEGKTVVITHHGPHPHSIAARFQGNPANAAFVSDLTDILREHKPHAWLHGHVHDSFDYQVSNTRVVANPRGYPLRRSFSQDGPRFENAQYNGELVVEV